MGRITTLEERMLFRELARAGHTDDEIAEQRGWSVSTVRKWRRRADQGCQALVSVMGRPATGALSTFPSLIRETIRAWRNAYPGRGPKTLRADLEADERSRNGNASAGGGAPMSRIHDPIRVLVVDDHTVVRKGIRALLATVEGIEVAGEARDGQEALEKIEALRPDVILLDLLMPRMDGIEVTRQAVAADPDARILVLTSFAADDKVFPAIKAGALGYLLKDTGPADLVRAIRQVYLGESSLSPAIARKVLQELSSPPDRPPTAEPLTEREVEVLQVVARGKSNQEIADELMISEATVRTHVSNILGKLHLASRTQAALYALREGLASLDDV